MKNCLQNSWRILCAPQHSCRQNTRQVSIDVQWALNVIFKIKDSSAVTLFYSWLMLKCVRTANDGKHVAELLSPSLLSIFRNKSCWYKYQLSLSAVVWLLATPVFFNLFIFKITLYCTSHIRTWRFLIFWLTAERWLSLPEFSSSAH